MGLVILVAVLGGVLWAGAAVVAGMAAPSSHLDFDSSVVLQERVLHASRSQVVAAYRQGIQRSPGTTVILESPNELVVDSKPSVRILGGAFGMIVRFRFGEASGDTAVSTEAAKKVRWAPSTKFELRIAATEIERRIRMAAKQAGSIDERR